MAKKAEKKEKDSVSGPPETPPDSRLNAGTGDVLMDAPPDTETPPGAPPDGTEDPPETTGEADPETPPEPEEQPKRYFFPRAGQIKCPGCGLYETVAVSTRGAYQVRKCTRSIPVCEYATHKTFKVGGVEIKSTDCTLGD